MAVPVLDLKAACTRPEVIGLVLSLMAAAIGGAMGFLFGLEVGGVVVGLMSAACAAMMGAFLVDSVYDVWERWASPR